VTISRREMLGVAGAASAARMSGSPQTEQQGPAKPNIVVIIADQVRWDALGAYGLNPMNLTPNLDEMAHRGTLFRNMFTNQPVCSPSRACLFTGEYPATHGVWRNAGRGIALSHNATTLATECRKAGYSANYIGKWHLANEPRGPVTAADRGGFLNLWQAANELEWTSHPYEGDLYDGDGRAIHYQNQYRVDFMTGLAKQFLKKTSKTSPFLLVVSYLEPHHQNDLGRMVAPMGYAEKYQNPFVPEDLKRFPGNWQEQLPDYYGCIKRIDEAVGEIRTTLTQEGMDRNTIFVFVSDHGCHFMTRNTEYKRSGHDASIHIPLVIDGPGFSGGKEVRELVSMVDLSPTLLSAAGLPVPTTMQGRSTLPLLSGSGHSWRNEVFIQLSEFWVGRALRTPEWTYVVAAPRGPGQFKPEPNAPQYSAFQLYDNRADPYQLVNLAGRKETVAIETQLRDRLKARMQEAGDKTTEVVPCVFPYA
jgi:arylsulfatase A-like enzyme